MGLSSKTRLGFVLTLLLTCMSQAFVASGTPHGTYDGFAMPIGSVLLDSAEQVFTSSDGSLSVSITTSDSAVYRYAYVSYAGSAWQDVELSGEAMGDEWLSGSAGSVIHMSPSDFGLSEDKPKEMRNFIVIYSCSRTGDSWDCHNGWQILQFNASFVQNVSVIGVSASGHQDYYLPENSLDGDMGPESRWSAEGDGEWIAYELSEVATVSYVRFAFYHSSSRYFDVQYSVDGETWLDTNATGMKSAPDMEGVFQRFDLEPVSARYVRFVGHGSDVPNLWNSMVEADITGYPVNLTSGGCTPQSFLKCHDGDVWWYDSCGQVEEMFDDCVSGEICAGGECVEEAPEPYCGDEACNGDETCATCEEDCGACENPDVEFSTSFEETDWESRIRSHFGTFSFQYSCSNDPASNYYERTTDPENSSNHVLHLVINNGCDYSGRVQGTIVMPDRDVYHYSQRYYLSEDFSMVEDTPTYMWLDLGEFWEEHEDSWDGNTAGQAQFSFFYLKNQNSYTFYWRGAGALQQPASVQSQHLFSETNYRPLPLGEWFTLDWYVERAEADGRYTLTITEEGSAPEVIFDIVAPTAYPGHRKPVTWYQPWKFYMNVEIVNYIKGRAGKVDIYYDDFKWFS